MILGAVYTLWTYNRVFFGNLKIVSLILYKDLDRKELNLFLILLFMLFIMGIFSYLFLDEILLSIFLILDF